VGQVTAPSNLGNRQATGRLDPANKVTPGGWVVTFNPAEMPTTDYEVYHGSAKGPGGYFHVYIDDTFYDVGENGLINAYDPAHAMYVRKGQTVSLHWSIATGTAPFVVLFLRVPEVGKL
jgi:hypothetical protein